MTTEQHKVDDLALLATLKSNNFDLGLTLKHRGNQTDEEQIRRVTLDYKWRGAVLDLRYAQKYSHPNTYDLGNFQICAETAVRRAQKLAEATGIQADQIKPDLERVLEEILRTVGEDFGTFEPMLGDLIFDPATFSWEVFILPWSDTEWSVADAERIKRMAEEIVRKEGAPLTVDVWAPNS